MADTFQDYVRSPQAIDGPAPGVRAIPIGGGPPGPPAMPDVTAGDKAMSAFGAELTAVANKLRDGQQHTLASQAMEDFLTQRAAITQKYSGNDVDFTTAERDAGNDLFSAKQSALGKIADPQLRARTSLEMQRAAITAQTDVRTAQVKRQADINIAGNDTLMQVSLNEAVSAPTPAQRAAAIDRYSGDLERLQAAGWIDAQTAVARAKTFQGQLDRADALTLIQHNPAAARTALADTAMFPTLDPVMRASLVIQAEQKFDANSQATLTNAAAFHPEAASLAAGHVISADHVGKIFNNGIVQIESGGDSAAVSPKGALGVSQIMPATARETAAAIGMKDVAALSDADLKAKLLSDPQLNARLGQAYFQSLVTRYDGNLPLAAAAYNAGPGRADAWKAAAEAKFGQNFSPAQLAEVVNIKETRDYLGKLYGVFKAPMDVQFSSPAAAMQASNAVGSVIAQGQAREAHLLSVQASAIAQSDPVADIVKQGYDVDPSRIANFRAAQTAAADKGDAAAAGRLRDLDTALKLQPFVRQAWATPPALLDGSIKNLQAQVAAPGASPTQSGLDALKAFQAVADEQEKRRDSEPVVLGGANGGRYYALQPITPQQPLDDTMTSLLKARDVQAQTAHRIYGGSGSPFTAEEATAWHQAYGEATPQDRAAMLGAFAKGLSPQTFAAALPQITHGTLAKDARPAITLAAGLFQADPAVAQSIVQGIDAQAMDKKLVPGGEANVLSYHSARDRALPMTSFPQAAAIDPRGFLGQMRDAIDARYAYLSAQAGDSSGAADTARLRRAVTDVTGGVLSHNGGSVIAPARGMTQQQFDGVLWSLTDADLAGAQTTGGKSITTEVLRDTAKLRMASPGQYFLQVNRDDAKPQYAVMPDGKPFVLDLRGRAAPPRATYTPYDSGLPLPGMGAP